MRCGHTAAGHERTTMTPQPAGMESAVPICALSAAVSTLTAALVDAPLPGFRGWLIAAGALFWPPRHLPGAPVWPDIA